MEYSEQSIVKWKDLIQVAKAYWIDSEPTGISDNEYDRLEKLALQDGFSVRDYVINTYLKGTKTKNQFIEKISKYKVSGVTMLNAIMETEQRLGTKLYCNLKYDGCSLAIYIDSLTGIPKRIVTVGNLNLGDYGVDQTWKLLSFLPRFPKGIVAVQAEAVIDLNRFPATDHDRARQKANGLINSKYKDGEVTSLLTLRAFRYYTDTSPEGLAIRDSDYREVLYSIPTVKSRSDGHILFCPAQVWTTEELYKDTIPGFCETDKTKTNSGCFLNDGWVLYDSHGNCQMALKYSGAGSETETVKSVVKGIQWNNQVPKGKDSWSANVIIEPVQVRGCTVTKPSAGSVSKLITKNISPGAIVSVILANSTIPMVGEVLKGGNGDFMWPTCSCGHKFNKDDIFGSLLKCTNPDCTDRIGRMEKYIKSLTNISRDLSLNEFLVIDRFNWDNTTIELGKLLDFVKLEDPAGYKEYLESFLSTSLQKKVLGIVWKASYEALWRKWKRLI